MKLSGIYEIVCKKNGKRYIGSSLFIDARRRYHFSLLRNGKHKNIFMQNDFIEFGSANFEFKILAILESWMMEDTEKDLVKKMFADGCVLYNSKGNTGYSRNRINGILDAAKRGIGPFSRKHKISIEK